MLISIEEVLLKELSETVLLYNDANSTMVGGIDSSEKSISLYTC